MEKKDKSVFLKPTEHLELLENARKDQKYNTKA